VDSVLW